MLTVHTTYRSGSLDIRYRAHQADLEPTNIPNQAITINHNRAALNLARLPANCGFLTLLLSTSGTIPAAAQSLHLKIASGKTVVCEFAEVALDTHVDWFCLGIFVRISHRWAFKEVLAFPDHRGEIDAQLIDLLSSVKTEISNVDTLDDSYTFLDFDQPVLEKPVEPLVSQGLPPLPPSVPSQRSQLQKAPLTATPVPAPLAGPRYVRPPSPLQVAVPGSVVRSVRNAAKSGMTSVSSFASPRSPSEGVSAPPHPRALPRAMDAQMQSALGPVASTTMSAMQESSVATDSLGHMDFFIHHNREVRSLQKQVERLEGELAKYRAKDKCGPTVMSPRAKNSSCEKCATSEAEVAILKERLVELEATAVLSELMGGSSKAEFLIVQEENRTLRLKNAELEGKCAVQVRMIDELKNVKRQLVDSITKIPKVSKSFVADISENCEDPVVQHIRVQERLIGALKEQLDILATQLTIGQALMGDPALSHDDEL